MRLVTRHSSPHERTGNLLLAATCVVVGVYVASGCSDRPDRGMRVPASLLETGTDDGLNPGVLIEGGTFLSGSDDFDADFPVGSPFSKEDEGPHWWTVESFWIQEHEVTNEEYRRFDARHEFPPGEERLPVVNVTWREAMAYAASVGGSLPTEVQWEFAARGTERREYPWGNAVPTCELAQYRDCDPAGPTVAMARPGDATPEGVYDLAGNVREWVTPVWFDPERHPVNHEALRLKGGSFAHPSFFLRAAARTKYFPTDYQWNNVGFRVVWPFEKGPSQRRPGSRTPVS